MDAIMLQPRSPIIDQAPPEPMDKQGRWPTLLYSWWCTCFALAFIIVRLWGRKVRSHRLFREDWVMAASIIPLFTRMGLIHVVLLYGTNNVSLDHYNPTPEQIRHRELGSKLVLAARIFYAAFIWTSKLTVSEFLKRITIQIWNKKYEAVLFSIRVFLGLTFFAVVVATLADCQPFDHHWQVVPSPAPQCRNGYANLLTMGIADIITDILLIVFPIPIVWKMGRNWKVKLGSSLLFCTSMALIIVTALRMPEVIRHRGRQQYRTVWASSEILASAIVSNFVIIGGFLRDKGTKKNKYKVPSATDSMDRSSTRRPTLNTLAGPSSDDDLFRSYTGRLPPHCFEEEPEQKAIPATAALTAMEMSSPFAPVNSSTEDTDGLAIDTEKTGNGNAPDGDGPLDVLPSPAPSKKAVSFFDIGGLLEDGSDQPLPRTNSGTATYDFAPPSPAQSRRGSRAFLSDLGGLLSSSTNRAESTPTVSGAPNGNANGIGNGARGGRRSSLVPNGILKPTPEAHEPGDSSHDLSTSDSKPLVSKNYTAPLPGHHGQSFDEQAPEPPRSYAQPLLPRASISTNNSRPTISRPPTQQSLVDVGGFLSSSHGPDSNSHAAQGKHVDGQGSGQAVAGARAPQKDSDEMSLHDPGGLLGG